MDSNNVETPEEYSYFQVNKIDVLESLSNLNEFLSAQFEVLEKNKVGQKVFYELERRFFKANSMDVAIKRVQKINRLTTDELRVLPDFEYYLRLGNKAELIYDACQVCIGDTVFLNTVDAALINNFLDKKEKE